MNTAAGQKVFSQSEAIPSISLTSGVDHVGLTVADLEHTIFEIRKLFGGGCCYFEGPINEDEPGWMVRKLGAREGSFSLNVAAVTLLGLNLELFNYRPLDGRSRRAVSSSEEFFGFIYTCPDPADFISTHSDMIARTSGTTKSWLNLETKSGLRLFVTQSDDESLIPGFFMSPGHIAELRPELKSQYGLMGIGRLDMPFGEGEILKGELGGSIAIICYPGLRERPASSDLGGHHLAFHAEDIDASAKALNAAGYRAWIHRITAALWITQ